MLGEKKGPQRERKKGEDVKRVVEGIMVRKQGERGGEKKINWHEMKNRLVPRNWCNRIPGSRNSWNRIVQEVDGRNDFDWPEPDINKPTLILVHTTWQHTSDLKSSWLVL